MKLMEDWNREISGIRAMAKTKNGITDEDVARMCGISAATIRKRSSERRLPRLSFWAVYVMAKMAGKRIRIEDDTL